MNINIVGICKNHHIGGKMNINYYNQSVIFLMIAIGLFILVFILTFVKEELYDEGYYGISKASTIIGIILIIVGTILFYLHKEYSKEYRKQCYEQCENYIKEKYNIEITEYYNQKGYVYIRGGDAEIKTHSNEGYYVEYELHVLNNGTIQYQMATIYKNGD